MSVSELRSNRYCDTMHEGISKEMLGGSSSHVSFVKNQREKTTRNGTTFSRSDIGEKFSPTSRYSNGFAKPNQSFLRRGRKWRRGQRKFSRRPVAKTRQTVSDFPRENLPSQNFREGRRVSCGTQHKRASRFATTKAVHWTKT